MESTFIAKVRKITKDSNGKVINIIIIDTTNGKPSIVRNFTQFMQDLKNSELIDDNVNSINHPQISGRTGILRGLRRGTVEGDIAYSKKGDTYKVTKDSRVITDITHPEFGNFVVGAERVATEDRAIVDGFLDLEPNKRFDETQANAEAKARAEMAMEGAFEDFGLVEQASVDELPEDIPTPIVDEVLGNKDTKNKKK